MPIYTEKIKDKKTGKMIDKLVDGKKQYYVRTYVIDEFGNSKQVTRHNKKWLGRDGFWEAQQEENRLKNHICNSYENFTLNDLFDLYYKYIKSKLKPSTIQKNKSSYEMYIKPILGLKKVFLINNKDILDFHKYLDSKTIEINDKNSKRNQGKHLLSVTYKQNIHTILTTILNFGCKYIGLNKNVASIVGNFKKPKGCVKPELNFLTLDEFQRFIKFESKQIYKDFFTILFYSGMRRGELLALTINDINLETNEININKSVNPKNGINSTVPKTDSSNRKIKMLSIVKETLIQYKKLNDNNIFGLEKIKPTTLQRRCDKNCKLAGIQKNIRVHDFRHSFASMCINRGIPIEIISEYLGHENIATTLSTYAHLYPNSQDKLVSILDKQD